MGKKTAGRLNTFDVVLLLLLGWGAIAGYRKGFLFMLFELLAILAGIMAGLLFLSEVMDALRGHLGVNENYLPFVAFLLIFAVTILVVRLVGVLTRWALHKTLLGPADKLMGAALGALKTACWLGLFIGLLSAVLPTLPWWMQESWIYATLSQVVLSLPGLS
jgi:membrane protein required for colicin V production